MNRLYTQQELALRKLAKRFVSRIGESGAKRILVTSVNSGDGKRLFIEALFTELGYLGERSFVSVDSKSLNACDPESFGGDTVLVLGPAFYDKEGLLAMPERWLRAFDAVIILVLARSTKQRDLKELIEWISEYKIGHIWPVWNEFKAPGAEMIWPRIKHRLGIGEKKRAEFVEQDKSSKSGNEKWREGPNSPGPPPVWGQDARSEKKQLTASSHPPPETDVEKSSSMASETES